MSELNNNDMIDLGSDPVGEDFDPFAGDDNSTEIVADNVTEAETDSEQPTDTPETQQPEATAPTQTKAPVPAAEDIATGGSPTEPAGFVDKPPVFEYAGATENINDASKTFDELRIEKSSDFPELEDGKRVSWTVEYGKITKTVADPKGMSVGKMKSDIETSKEFEDSLKKRGADKNPTCKIKPRVTAQSKGLAASYRGVFASMEDAETAGKVISIIPARDGKVYEIRNNAMGNFITPVVGCDLLSEVKAGFIPALPRIPMYVMMQIVTLFRHYTRQGNEREALVNLYFDKKEHTFVVDVPEQTVTKVSVNSKTNDEYSSDRYIHYMDIHSHNNMKAFFSSTDDSDEKATRLYSVIGRMDKYFPDIKTRISNGGKFLEIDPAEVFEYISSPIPDEWKERIIFNEGDDGREVRTGEAG